MYFCEPRSVLLNYDQWFKCFVVNCQFANSQLSIYNLCSCQSIIKKHKSNTTIETSMDRLDIRSTCAVDLLSYLNTIFHALIVKDYHYPKHIFKYTGIRHLSFWWPYLIIMMNVISSTLPRVKNIPPTNISALST